MFLPFEVSHDGDDDIEAVEGGFEGDAFDDVEVTTHGIDEDPEEPLLDVFAGQRPQADKAQGIGEAVEDRHVTVGVVGEDEPGDDPGNDKKEDCCRIESFGHKRIVAG